MRGAKEQHRDGVAGGQPRIDVRQNFKGLVLKQAPSTKCAKSKGGMPSPQ